MCVVRPHLSCDGLLCIVWIGHTIDCSIKLTTSNVDFMYNLFHDDRIGNDVPDVMPSNNHVVQDYDFLMTSTSTIEVYNFKRGSSLVMLSMK